MSLKLIRVLSGLVAVAMTAVPAASNELAARSTDASTTCDTDSAIPFYRCARPQSDHFYTVNYNEMQTSVDEGSVFEGNMGLVFRSPTANTTLFYRLYNVGATDHFYTTNQGEADVTIQLDGYTTEGTAAYVYSDQICGSIPLYRLYAPGDQDHFYTTNETERDSAVAYAGYIYEGIACYVLPNL
ncbi:uncharacterized protein C8Q71DRAFT_883285 [Rhodofomes roseus]|uniref:DUF5648 domain-containing protein n=1 Tax=Rhodofomes roseus TaxID=34475 RepID=A0ABQ8K3M8_9APHY|nr:uncharacterized protein C8Q71DRAFT_883285 [Rhodofomes roseus]KAH9830969.1 hypothetical protein C8Q71DRAFT_883285 [Rhodofomes roseus]